MCIVHWFSRSTFACIQSLFSRCLPPPAWFRFSAFADLFSESTRRGLKSLQIQNPALYFHNAALYAIERKQYAQLLCLEAAKVLTLSQAASILGAGDQTVYFGQRPWRRGLSGGCGYRFNVYRVGCPLVWALYACGCSFSYFGIGRIHIHV